MKSKKKYLEKAEELSNLFPLEVRTYQNGLTFSIIVRPRSKRTEIVGISNGALKVKVTAPPIEGAANEALIELLSQSLGIKRSDLEILKMKTSPRKLI
ncbi:MAG: DUF167 domain-containing protein, partial [Desulfobacterota bacterium]|nr:DUF167 domain-containing protein [Thermodesulfobacteriota bacterium]